MTGAAQHWILAGERDCGDERLGHPLVRIIGGVDGIGDRAEEPLRLAADQRFDQIVAPGIAAVGGHP